MLDEPLTPQERAALDALPREAAPPPHLEDRVVAELHRAGLLRSGRTGTSGRRRIFLRVAAAILVLAAGVLLGRLTARPEPSPGGQSYLLLLYGDASQSGRNEQALFAEYGAWAGELRRRRQLIAAERLRPERRVVGNAAGMSTAAPVGFFLIRADSFESAAATAAECPHIKYGGTIVIRPAG
jgi:hypothetical protein